jgi:hypothetical protein
VVTEAISRTDHEMSEQAQGANGNKYIPWSVRFWAITFTIPKN